MYKKDALVLEILNNLRFVTTIAIFFVAVLQSFYEILDLDNTEKTSLPFAGVVIGYILAYVLFTLWKDELDLCFLKMIHYLNLAGIASFIIPLLHFVSLTNRIDGIANIILIKISLISIIGTPFLLLSAIVMGKHWKWISELLRLK